MKRLLLFSYLAPALALAGGCTTESQPPCAPCREGRTVAVSFAAPAADALRYPIYLFRRAVGTTDDYRFERMIDDVPDGTALKLPLEELRRSDYRFLMVARPDAAPLTLHAVGSTLLDEGTRWQYLRLECPTGEALLDLYVGFADYGGAALLETPQVHLALARLAGQPVFDFYRIGASIDDPVGIAGSAVSVLDRVRRIEITYHTPATVMRFDDSGALTADAFAARPIVQVIEPALTGFSVALPQSDLGLESYDPALKGSLRIMGRYLLPAADKLRVHMLFTYYDTTPACGNKHTGDHDASCFVEHTLTLDLPATDAPAGLPVAADCFTVCRAGLRADRIIDVVAGAGMVTEFGWK